VAASITLLIFPSHVAIGRSYGATAFQRQPSLGSVTVNDLGDFDASATTFSVVPPRLKFVV
jgi:hypothetical protein